MMNLPTLLSFERKLETSDALMYAGNWSDMEKHENWSAIPITKRQNRSTQSAFGTKDENKSQPNPVSSDSDDANLPHDKNTLKVSFTLRFIGNLGRPFACNDPDFEKKIVEKVNVFKEKVEGGLESLAFRYAYNIANGRFLWRNRVGAESVIIRVFLDGQGNEPLEFNAREFALNNFDKNSSDENLKKLTLQIHKGLKGNDDFVFLKIDAYVKLGNGQHIFPSQEMNMGEKKKVLFKLNDCAAIHNVKIGNALRTVDNWYENAEFPIAAEPFGAVTQRGQAYRKTKDDLYTLMLNWIDKDDLSDNNKKFVVANIIRGGVFSGKGN